ncbi:two-component regulator propeller domain-containing protein [soil metagenome]
MKKYLVIVFYFAIQSLHGQNSDSIGFQKQKLVFAKGNPVKMQPNVAAQQYTFTNYTQEQGLQSGTIQWMQKDEDGFLWLSSEEGLSRFDGYNFKNFNHNPDDSTSFPDGNPGKVFVSITNEIYFEHWLGICKYNPQSLTFTTHFAGNDSTWPAVSFRLNSDKEATYLLTRKNIIREHHSKYEYFPLPFQYNDNVLIASDSMEGVMMNKGDNVIYSFKAGEKTFEKFMLTDRSGQPDSSLHALAYIKSENKFFAFSSKHIYRFNKQTNTFVPAADLSQLKNSRLGFGNWANIRGNFLYRATNDGWLYKLNIMTGEEKFFYLNKRVSEEGRIYKDISSTTIDDKGWLWMSSWGMGVFRFNPTTDEWEQFLNEPGNSNSLPSNDVFGVFPDKNGVVWVICVGHGLVKMEAVIPLMSVASPSGNKIISVRENKNIRSFLETETGYWVGTLDGLFNFDSAKNQFSELTRGEGDAKVNYGSAGKILRDGSGNIWVAEWNSRLTIIDTKNNKYISPDFFTDNVSGKSILGNFRGLLCDRQNTMWIATYNSGLYTVKVNDLNFDNPSELNLNSVQHDEKDITSLSSNQVFSLGEDSDGNIWAGTINGLNRYNAGTGKWTRYFNLPGNEHSLHGNEVRSFALDKKGRLWIGTKGGGLNRYNKVENNFTHFTMQNGLPNNAVYSIVCDNNGMLWLGTNHGICRFNPDDFTCKNFTLKDGIQNYEFNTGATLKLKDGTLLIGGADGYNIINPDKVDNSKTLPPNVVISSIKVFDREVPPGDNHLELKYTQNSLTFEFAALSYYKNQYNRYAYKLEPVETDWIYSNDRRFVSYSNLKPGDYIFKVKACNSEGVWNETGTQLSICITPPWWKTWWFRSGMLLLIIFGTFWFFQNRTASLRKQKLLLENTVEQRTHDLREQKEIAEQERKRAEQSEKFKQQFLANMSHEIRTPMNAVMGMTALVLDSPLNPKQKKYLTGVKKASDNLLRIINDILDLSKVEAGKIELEQIDFSLNDVIEQVSETLQHKADEKGIELIADVESSVPDIVIGDPVRLNQVLMNLAGNAIKFTEKGSVSLKVQMFKSLKLKSSTIEPLNHELLNFSIEDTGIGIPKEKLESVFESFSQAHLSDTRIYGGTGLGLSISKQLVELMGGKISIESEEGSGSTFSFTLEMPIGSKEKILEQKSSEQIDGSILNGLNILLVDDNADNRIVARDTLESKATVTIIEATNGKEAVKILLQEDFDIVLMDVQMPVMDGYQATQEIRNTFSSPKKDIPIIALTASVVRSDLDKCRAAGMNDYVPKPFKTHQLITSIAKLTGREIKYKPKDSGQQTINKEQSSMINGHPDSYRESIVDLTYLEQFCEGDKIRMQKYTNIFLDSAPILIEKLNAGLSENNFQKIANQIHGFKTKWIMMGMKEANEIATKIELDCRRELTDYSSIKKETTKLISIISAAINEIRKV